MSSSLVAPPQVSVIVRSFNRLPALCRLLPALLAPRPHSVEIVLNEQSTQLPDSAVSALAAMEQDPRVRVLRSPPLGGPRARNLGVRAARGEILLFIDDDDLPGDADWIAGHVANYGDPRCLGVTGRHLYAPGEAPPYANARRAYRRCLGYSRLLKLPWTYARQGQRKVGVAGVHGTGGSVRRSAVTRFGGWDEDTRIEDEASFCLRVQQGKRPDEYFVFDPVPTLLRGMDVPGGLGKRYMTTGAYFDRFLDFVHNILGRYHPRRVALLYPLYVLSIYGWTLAWLWEDSKRHVSLPQRVGSALWLLATLPLRVTRRLLVLALMPTRPDAYAGPTGSGKGFLEAGSDRAPRSVAPSAE